MKELEIFPMVFALLAIVIVLAIISCLYYCIVQCDKCTKQEKEEKYEKGLSFWQRFCFIILSGCMGHEKFIEWAQN